MTVKERILLSRLAEKIDRQPDYAERIGISVSVAVRTFPLKDRVKRRTGIMEAAGIV